jgi:hypothetical protein
MVMLISSASSFRCVTSGPYLAMDLSIAFVLLLLVNCVGRPCNSVVDEEDNYSLQNPIFFLIILAGLALSYSPVLFSKYGFTDDYWYLNDAKKDIGETWRVLISSGRPVLAYVFTPIFAKVSSIDNLAYLRTITVLGITGLAWVLYRSFSNIGWPREQACLLALIVCLTPPFQVYAGWAQYFHIGIVSVAAAAAFWITSAALKKESLAKRLYLTVCAVFVLTIAINTYQISAMFFWVFVAVGLLGQEARFRDVLRDFCWYGSVMASGLLVSYVMFRYFSAVYPHVGTKRGELTGDVIGKFTWFLTGPLNTASAPLSLSPHLYVTLVVWILIIVGLFMYFQGSTGRRIGMLGLCLMLVPLTYTPNLVVAENIAPYRTQMVLTSLIVIYLFAALRELFSRFWNRDAFQMRYAFSVILCVVAIMCCLIADYNVAKYFALPGEAELRLVSCKLARLDLRMASKIHFIMSPRSNSLAPNAIDDEFGLPSSYQVWVPESLVRLILSDIAPSKADIPVERVAPENAGTVPGGASVVDARDWCR